MGFETTKKRSSMSHLRAIMIGSLWDLKLEINNIGAVLLAIMIGSLWDLKR